MMTRLIRRLVSLGSSEYVVVILLVVAGIALVAYASPQEPPESDAVEEMGDPYVENSVSKEEKAAFVELLRSVKKDSGLVPREFFEAHYDTFGPEVMAVALDANPFCHDEAHNLGRTIYERQKNLAVSTSICRSACHSGCLHGVLMEMFESEKNRTVSGEKDHVSIADLTPELQALIRKTCTEQDILRYTVVGGCFHAIGHALMALTEYDISSGLELCSLFREEGLGPEYYCTTGIFMERDLALGKADARVSATYPCTEFKNPAACFRYKFHRLFKLPEEYEQTAEICRSLTGPYRQGCFHGLGKSAYKLVYRDHTALERLCASGDVKDVRMCMEGVFGYINLYDKTLKSSEHICKVYTGPHKDVCAAASKMGNFSMAREFTRYVHQ